MTRLFLAGVVTASAAVVLVSLVPYWHLRRFLDHRAARRFPRIAPDPYLVIATVWSRTDDGVLAAAAAALLGAGLITVGPDGVVRVTDRGSAPRHPLEAALLGCLYRAGRPVTLAEIRSAGEWRARRDAFFRVRVELLPRGARQRADGVAWTAMVIVVGLSLFYTVQLTYFGETLIVPFAVLWLLVVVPVGWTVSGRWPRRRYLFREYCAEQPPHPALSRLDTAGRDRLVASLAHQPPAGRKVQPEPW
ncbi:hypothetical protein [Actinoplanes rectilineatus]|uniref:hypothetical protein n=1 Tax=Actinoplanes rectilineatus TaxID=113571 RepID=UPI0005F28849|nr:hypothetical protein [Actinoplanes rectilineatus]